VRYELLLLSQRILILERLCHAIGSQSQDFDHAVLCPITDYSILYSWWKFCTNVMLFLRNFVFVKVGLIPQTLYALAKLASLG
jgi:hypothetical protein